MGQVCAKVNAAFCSVYCAPATTQYLEADLFLTDADKRNHNPAVLTCQQQHAPTRIIGEIADTQLCLKKERHEWTRTISCNLRGPQRD